jgi:sporulation protein YlmC with PRC-barrel domain
MTWEELHHNLIASDRVEGTPVRRSTGEKIGKIERLMIDKATGQVAYAILTFGGFLGNRTKHLPIPWQQLHYDQKTLAYELDISKDQLDHAPSYTAETDFDWGNRAEVTRLDAYYRLPF